MRLSNAVFAISFVACSVAAAQSIATNYAPGTDFSKYHTYKWVVVQGRQHPDPTKDAQIKDLIDRQLTTKGLEKRDNTADLSVAYQVAFNKTEKWKAYNDWTFAVFVDESAAKAETAIINKGTLVLDMYDPAAKKLVWTGSVTKTIDTNDAPASLEKKQKIVPKAVQALLKNYPPK